MPEVTARQLLKQIPPLAAQLNFEGTDTITIVPSSNSGWEVVQPHANANLYLVWRGYIDLAGYAKEDLTLFTQSVDIQKGPFDIGTNIDNTIICDYVTTRKIRDDEIGLLVGFLPPTSLPGLDLQEVVYGEWTNRVPYSATNPVLRGIDGSTVGSGNPTASERLHITRIAATFSSSPDAVLYLAGCNYVIGAVTTEEKDLVYIERLRRAYTQQRSET